MDNVIVKVKAFFKNLFFEVRGITRTAFKERNNHPENGKSYTSWAIVIVTMVAIVLFLMLPMFPLQMIFSALKLHWLIQVILGLGVAGVLMKPLTNTLNYWFGRGPYQTVA